MRDTSFFAAGPRPWLQCSRSTQPQRGRTFVFTNRLFRRTCGTLPGNRVISRRAIHGSSDFAQTAGLEPATLTPGPLNRWLLPSELCLRMTRSAEGVHPGRKRSYGRHGLPPALLSHAGPPGKYVQTCVIFKFFQKPLDIPRIAWYIRPRNKNGHRPRRKTK